MRELGKLSVAKINKLVAAGRPGRHGDGRGLVLQISQWKTASWLLRYTADGRERYMGLGSVRDVPLAQARQRAREHRSKLWDGIDPIEARRETRANRLAAVAKRLTFEAAAQQYISTHEAKWRSSVHAKQWTQSLAAYVYPQIGDLPVQAIDTPLVLKCLEPIWATKPETARRVRSRIELVLNWATARKHRTGENPARWSGLLEHLLPEHSGSAVHHAAMPYAAVPAFLAELQKRPGVAPMALEFLVLTGARTSEVLKATFEEIDLDTAVWVIPGSRMKSGVEHRVPLSGRALEILRALPHEDGNPHVFVGAHVGKSLYSMTMRMLMRRAAPEFTVHGFRSSFRTWASEQTAFPHEVLEAALAHKVPSAVERAYQRGDLLRKRRQLMDAWAAYCTSPARPATEDNVTPIRAQQP